jgi:uncharacterized protein YcgI (DUF1989 family)
MTLAGTWQTILPARTGLAVRLSRGDAVGVVNTYGSQVVDTWAFSAGDMGEFMSMDHSRTALMRLIPAVGDTLVTNRRRAILSLVADTSPGVHDTLIAACDSARYAQLGGDPGHENCSDNLGMALAALGLARVATPAPLNLFMNVAVGPAGALEMRAPVSAPGDRVELRAEMDAVVVFSACPQDIMPVNNFFPTSVELYVRPHTG